MQSPLAPREVREWEPGVALTLIGRIVYCNEQTIALLTSGAHVGLPCEGDDAIAGPVAIPRRTAFHQLPLAVADDRLAQHFQQLIIELSEFWIGRLVRTAAEMRGNAFLAALELSLVKEPKPGGQERDHGRGL